MPADSSNGAWSVPPELEGAVPRRVRLSGMGITYSILAAASIVAGVAIASHAIRDELRRDAESQSLTSHMMIEGRETEGTVTRLYTGLGVHGAGYDYSVDGRNYSRGAEIAPEHWRSLQVGSPLTILYLPSNPTESYPESDPPNSHTHWYMALPLAGMALFFMFSFAFIQLSAILPKRRLLAWGRPVRAVVTRYTKGSQGRSSGYFLYYEFSLADGSQCQGKEFKGSQLAESSAITVLYDPENPRRNTIYPMEMVKLAST
jgi:hypothetical protein